MKRSRILVITLLVLLMFGGWISLLTSNGEKEADQYERWKEEAEEYFARGLYEKAIDAYEAAAALSGKEEDYASLLTAYASRYEESAKIYNRYVNAAKNAVKAYPENMDFTRIAAELLIEGEDYGAAYRYLKEAEEGDAGEEKLAALRLSTQYAWSQEWSSYRQVRPASNGYYAAESESGWSYIALNGKQSGNNGLAYAGPVGMDGVRVIYDGERGLLTDSDDVLQGILDFVPEEAGAYAEGLVAICGGGSYGYYDLLGDKQFGNYAVAGTFADGIAAVCGETGWYLIDTAGNPISQIVYTDIRLNSDGTCLKKERILAQRNGFYALYDAQEQQVGDFTCTDIDIVTDDGWVAYSDGGQWGFVDLDGNVVLPPAYAGARSFCEDLAAVYNGELWGFINRDGKLVVDYQFADALYFADGCCMVKTGDEEWHLIKRYLRD